MPTGIGDVKVMVMVTHEPGTMPVILNENSPWGKARPKGMVPHGVEIAAVRLVMEPLLVVNVAVPVPVAVFTVALVIGGG